MSARGLRDGLWPVFHTRHTLTHIPVPASHRTHTHAHTVAMNANRQITGTLRGFDQFMNLVLDGTVDVKNKVDIGMVVSRLCACHQAIRHGWCCSVCGGGQTHPCTHAWSCSVPTRMCSLLTGT